MASARIKEIKEFKDGKEIADTLKYLPVRLPVPWPDPIGPVKYDAFEGIMRSYLDLMPRVAQRIDSIEAYLEKDQGKPYVRPEERPDVGGEALTEVLESVRLLEQRIAKVESARKS